jgi:hypothetical protein
MHVCSMSICIVMYSKKWYRPSGVRRRLIENFEGSHIEIFLCICMFEDVYVCVYVQTCTSVVVMVREGYIHIFTYLHPHSSLYICSILYMYSWICIHEYVYSHVFFRTSLFVLHSHTESRLCNPIVVIFLK